MENSQENHMPTPVVLAMLLLNFCYNNYLLQIVHTGTWYDLIFLYMGKFITLGTFVIVGIRLFEIGKPYVIRLWNYIKEVRP